MVAVVNRYERLQKLNKDGTKPPWDVLWGESDWPSGGRELVGVKHKDGRVLEFADDYGTDSSADAALIVECRNSLPAVLNLIEAAQQARRFVQDALDGLGELPDEEPSIEAARLMSAEAILSGAVAVFVSGQEEPK